MKKCLIVCLVLSYFISPKEKVNAQENPEKIKSMKSWIFLIGNESNSYNKIGPVFLYEIKDSSIVISKNMYVSDLEIPVFDIGLIKVRRKNSVVRGIVIGAVTGFVAGGITGLLAGDDPEDQFLAFTAQEKALALGTYLGIAGLGVGAIAGSIVKISIPIHGNIDLFKQNKDRLRSYSKTCAGSPD